MAGSVGAISAPELAERLARGEPPVVLDVREPWEFELARIPGSLPLPLGELVSRCRHLDPAAETVVVCHHGVRSMHAAMYLAGLGFERVKNLTGGIEAWSVEVDPETPRY